MNDVLYRNKIAQNTLPVIYLYVDYSFKVICSMIFLGKKWPRKLKVLTIKSKSQNGCGRLKLAMTDSNGCGGFKNSTVGYGGHESSAII